MTTRDSRPEELPDDVELIITPRTNDIGAFEVQRLLPFPTRRMVGPFIFVDQMGPAVVYPDKPMDVRPHPHIGLATVTYMLDGTIVHKDSLGYDMTITPGAVNLMTAGSGIVHSERSDPAALEGGQSLLGMQIWMALPHHLEETEAAFDHYPADSLPQFQDGGVTGTVVVGEGFGLKSPVKDYHSTLYANLDMTAGARIEIPGDVEERALFLLDGSVTLNGHRVRKGDMLVLQAGTTPLVEAETESRLQIFGGATMDGPRNIWWNFVSSSKDRIELAKADWKADRFGKVGDDPSFIPLPE